MNLYFATIRQAIKLFPDIVPHLKGKARWVAFGPYGLNNISIVLDGKTIISHYKTYEYYLSELSRMVTNVYAGNLGGEFIDLLAALIYGQLDQAYRLAWKDEGGDSEFPSYLQDSFEDMYLSQFDFVDQYYRDIVDARVDETPIDPLLARAVLWAQQWETAYKQAVELIHLESGGNLTWRKGDTERGCSTCAALDGITMSAREWQELDVHPRGYPNNKLECQGGGPANFCDCELEPTDKRRSPDAYARVIDIVSK